jgi:hypothetical protein
MKGLVFTTFYDFVERRHGPDLLDDVIAESGVPDDGAYTSVGTYPFQDMVALVSATAKLTSTPLPALLEAFGEHCFQCWVGMTPEHFDGKDVFDVLASIDQFHEGEVRKLYPDAELPSFQVESRDATTLSLRYFSCKPLADLATGVIKGASRHLNDPVSISHQAIADAERPYVQFIISRQGTLR